MNQYQNQPYQDDDLISLSEIFTILFRGKWWIIGSTLLCTLGAFLYLLIVPPIYNTTAMLQLPSPAYITEIAQPGSGRNATSAIEVIKSSAVIEAIIAKEKLDISVLPNEKVETNTKIKVATFTVPDGMIGKPYLLITTENSTYQLKQDGKTILTGKAGEVSKAIQEGGDVEILVTELNSQANAEFLLEKQSTQQVTANLLSSLSVSEQGKNTNIITLTLAGSEPENDRKILDALIDQYLSHQFEKESKSLTGEKQQVELALHQLKERLDLAQARYEFLSKSGMVSTQKADKTAAQQMVAIQDEQLKVLNLLSAKYEDLANYLDALNTALAWNAENGSVSVLSYSQSSIAPIKPKKSLILVLATLLGGMMGVGIVFVRAMFNQELKAEQLEKLTPYTVYATVPFSDQQNRFDSKAPQKITGDQSLLANVSPSDQSVENLRTLRTNLLYDLAKANNNRVMVTSPLSGAGNSFMTTNLAELLAQIGKTVLLVDANIRKDNLVNYFNIKSGSGLADMLAKPGSHHIMEINDQLHLLPAGSKQDNPTVLLASQAFAELLERFSKEYDVVLIDTPAVLPVTDAALVGEHCATNLMVVNVLNNRIEEVLDAGRRLEQVGISVHGCVMNGSKNSVRR
ncbi:polysaccharide biosynthesis tyrosine autokinase [Endozoicomonas ascidiicola]|uniref:polysaccharide biosynthesis tyrosine autokinase n=1 Tax=Endozoicomonas ascidiicola TaxID=1698521 RepID=UPI000A4F3CDF|nr:polysaccharide biosynthesis tyrosine autokinase [Endozoicomonas ascidiicola]